MTRDDSTQRHEPQKQLNTTAIDPPANASGKAELGQSLTQVFSSPVIDIPTRQGAVAPIAPADSIAPVAPTPPTDAGTSLPTTGPSATSRTPISPSAIFEKIATPPSDARSIAASDALPEVALPSPVLPSTVLPSHAFSDGATPQRELARPHDAPMNGPQFRDVFRDSAPVHRVEPVGLGTPPSLRAETPGPSPYTQVINPPISAGMLARVDTVGPTPPKRPPSAIPVVIAVGLLVAALLVIGALLFLGSRAK